MSGDPSPGDGGTRSRTGAGQSQHNRYLLVTRATLLTLRPPLRPVRCLRPWFNYEHSQLAYHCALACQTIADTAS
jgi:hypothetical protein